jgi:hypothetical protein
VVHGRLTRRDRREYQTLRTLPGGGYGEEYTLSNPLSGGELVILSITGGIGYGIADFVGRYLDTTPVASGAAANSTPTGASVPNDVAVIGWPSWQSMLAKFAIAAVPGIASAFVDSPFGRASLQGMMLGSGFSLLGDVWRNAMASIIGTSAIGQQTYLAEYEAQQAQSGAAAGSSPAATPTTAPATAPTAPAVGMSGLPQGVGQRRMLRPSGYLPIRHGLGQATAAPVSAAAVSPPSGGPGAMAPAPASPLGGGSGCPPFSQISQSMQGGGCAPHGTPPSDVLTNTGAVIPTAGAGTDTGTATAGPSCATPAQIDALANNLAANQSQLALQGLGKTNRLPFHAYSELFPDN